MTNKNTRKTLKKNAKRVLKGHYFLLVFACLMAAFLGNDFANSFFSSTNTTKQVWGEFKQVVEITENNSTDTVIDLIKEEIETAKESSAGTSLARSRGVMASVVNNITNGLLFYRIIQGINSFVKSDVLARKIFIIIFMIGYFLVWVFITNTFSVSFRRVFLESRTYKKVDVQKFTFLFYDKCLFNVAMAMLLRNFLLILWGITVIGFPIKYYTYKLVPYILAENPKIGPLKAIKISKEMMRGHKWEAFKLDFSFILWDMLGYITSGILGMLFVNPYKIATIAEYYVYLRELAMEKNSELALVLNDKFLYRIADKEEINEKYKDLIKEYIKDVDTDDYNLDGDVWLANAIESIRRQKGKSFNEDDYKESKGAFKWFEENLGLSFRNARYNRIQEKYRLSQLAMEELNKIKNGEIYPERLSKLPFRERRVKADYMRMYSMFSIVIIFFLGSVIGWTWEGMLHLIQKGSFVNRGALNGPWIPIYGVGAVFSITLGYRFRKTPLKEFLFIVVISGIVEYLTSYCMEALTGLRWWSYNNYFLNLNGRICLEGLLIFGIGGCAVVYWLIPYVEGQLKKLNGFVVSILMIVLVAAFVFDMIYSKNHPNTGKGVTSTVVGIVSIYAPLTR